MSEEKIETKQPPAKPHNPNGAGRKWFDGKDEELVVGKLEEAFAMGCPVTEACLFADIDRTTYYDYIKDKPQLVNRFEQLKDKPILKARKTVVDGLAEPEHAKWYLERKRKDEFSSRQELTGKEGRDLNMGIAFDDPDIKAIKDKAEDDLANLYKKRITKKTTDVKRTA